MKKSFFLVAALAATMSLMAEQPAVDFVYNLTAGDKNAEGTEFTEADKVAVAADEKLVSGENFDVYNAYATTYKVVGMTQDTAYSHMRIGDKEIDLTINRIQGQDNPKDADGSGPATSLKVPVSGACYKIEVKKDGYMIVVVKATPNKNQFAFEDLTGAGSTLAATPIEFFYMMMSHNTGEETIGEPDGCLMNFYKGDEYSELHMAPSMPYQLYPYKTGTYSTSGAGIMLLPVSKDVSPYIVGTSGSKMMAAGFAFVEDTAGLVITALGSKGVEGVDYADVQLFPGTANLKVQDCSKVPVEFKATVTMPEEWMADTVGLGDNIKKCSAYIWGDNLEGKIYELAAVKDDAGKASGVYNLSFKSAVAEKINVVFLNGSNWNGDENQTVDINGLEPETDYCYIVNFNKGEKATVSDCGTGWDELLAAPEVMGARFIMNGRLFIRSNGKLYNAHGFSVR